MNRVKKALAWYMRARNGYLAPEALSCVRCTRGESVLVGTIYADGGTWIQVLVEGTTLVTVTRGPWKVETL